MNEYLCNVVLFRFNFRVQNLFKCTNVSLCIILLSVICNKLVFFISVLSTCIVEFLACWRFMLGSTAACKAWNNAEHERNANANSKNESSTN